MNKIKEFFKFYIEHWLYLEVWRDIYTYLFAPITGFIFTVGWIIAYIQSYGKSNDWIFILIGIFLLLSSYKLAEKDYKDHFPSK